MLTLQYAACQQLGVVLGFFINYGVTKRYAGTDNQWRLPTLLQIAPAVVWGLSTFLCPESPRWLLSKDRRIEAVRNLTKLRNLPPDHPVIVGELAGMDSQLLHEMESVAGATQWDLLNETFIPVENRRRFFLIFMATLFSQWSGANAITQCDPFHPPFIRCLTSLLGILQPFSATLVSLVPRPLSSPPASTASLSLSPAFSSPSS